jgi:hypothetical protein
MIARAAFRHGKSLEGASDDQLATVEILPTGYGLHWEELDVDLDPGLLSGIFGTRSYMAPCGCDRVSRQGGSTPQLRHKGGRPRKNGLTHERSYLLLAVLGASVGDLLPH